MHNEAPHWDGLEPKISDIATDITTRIISKYVVNYYQLLGKPVHINLDGVEADYYIRDALDVHRFIFFAREKNFLTDFLKVIHAMHANHSPPVVWDAGAERGLYSILAAKAGAYVVSIEPHIESAEKLTNNLLLNNIPQDKIRLVPYALGRYNGPAQLYDAELQYGHCPTLMLQEGFTRNIKMRSIDALVSTGLPSPQILKIDVEGAELETIYGMSILRDRHALPKHLFLEVHPAMLPAFSTDLEILWEVITVDFGYALNHYYSRGTGVLAHFINKDNPK